jgi:hypothetical protein
VKVVKLLVAILLLPVCAALTLTVLHLAHTLMSDSRSLDNPAVVAFCVGYGLWLMVFLCLPKPMRTYVLGHELTHALWALMMGARVSGLRVRKTGGQVQTSKSNWLITLAPYFFPFYAMLFIALFFLAHAIWKLDAYMWVLFLFVGLGWSFHVTFTLMMLLGVRQPDVQSQGRLFSLVMIYGMNLLAIALVAALLSPRVRAVALTQDFGHSLALAYGWTLDNLRALWHALRHFRGSGS